MKIIEGMAAASVALLALCFGSSAATAATGLDDKGHLQAVSPRVDAAFAYVRLTSGVQVRVRDVTKNVIFYAPKTVRVNANLGENYWTALSLVVIGTPQLIPFTLSETDHALTIQSAKLRIEVNKTTGALRFVDAAGRLYTEEKADAPQTLNKVTISGAPDEAIYGFGFNGDDRARTLTVGPRQGSVPGLVRQRKLSIALMTATGPGGFELARATKQVTYAGKRIVVRL
jgi:alpha-D-xyloside xylohydrolase